MRARNKWQRRDKKRNKRKFGMRVHGRSVKTLAHLVDGKSRKEKKS